MSTGSASSCSPTVMALWAAAPEVWHSWQNQSPGLTEPLHSLHRAGERARAAGRR